MYGLNVVVEYMDRAQGATQGFFTSNVKIFVSRTPAPRSPVPQWQAVRGRGASRRYVQKSFVKKRALTFESGQAQGRP